MRHIIIQDSQIKSCPQKYGSISDQIIHLLLDGDTKFNIGKSVMKYFLVYLLLLVDVSRKKRHQVWLEHSHLIPDFFQIAILCHPLAAPTAAVNRTRALDLPVGDLFFVVWRVCPQGDEDQAYYNFRENSRSTGLIEDNKNGLFYPEISIILRFFVWKIAKLEDCI